MGNHLLERFLRRPPALAEGTELRVTRVAPDRVLLQLRQDQSSVELVAAALSRPYPSALQRLLAADASVDAVIVEHIPAGFDDAAQRASVSYLDVRGRGRVERGNVRYRVEPPGEAGRVSRRTSDPFAPKATRITRAFLAAPERRLRLSDLTSEVGLEPGHAHRVLMALVESGYVERDFDDYVVVDAGGLLDAWADATRRPAEYLALPVVHDLQADVERLVNQALDGQAVVSGELGAELLAPYLAAERAVVHVLSHDAWAEVEGWSDTRRSPVGEIDRIFVDAQDAGVAHFASMHDGLRVASPAQVYVDLRADRGRGREAAEEVRRRLLQF